MRALLVALDDPWRTSHGGTQRSRLFAAGLTAAVDDVVCVYAAGADASKPRLVDGTMRVPVPMVPLGERKLPAPIKRLKKALLPMPTVAGSRSHLMSAAIREHGPFDLVVAQQLRTAPYVEDAPGAKLWFDQVDLWSTFAATEAARRRGVARTTAGRQQAGFARLESDWGRRAAILSAAGYADAQVLGRRVARTVGWLPNAVESIPDVAACPRPGDRTAGLFANFAYWPNVDAYNLLARQWFPALRRAGVRVVVGGHGSQDLPAIDGIERLGPVDTPADFYRGVDVTLAPINLGGGIKVKVLESLMYDRPVFATAAALEGFSPDVRALAYEVDPRAPVFDDAAFSAAPSLVGHPALDPFRTDSFVASVGAALETIT